MNVITLDNKISNHMYFKYIPQTNLYPEHFTKFVQFDMIKQTYCSKLRQKGFLVVRCQWNMFIFNVMNFTCVN